MNKQELCEALDSVLEEARGVAKRINSLPSRTSSYASRARQEAVFIHQAIALPQDGTGARNSVDDHPTPVQEPTKPVLLTAFALLACTEQP